MSIYCFGQNSDIDTVVVKSDTVFRTQIINGHRRVVREISIYDTLYLVKTKKIRNAEIAIKGYKTKFRTKLKNLYFPKVNNIFNDISLTFGYSNSLVSASKQSGIYNIKSNSTFNYNITGIFNYNINNWVVSTGLGVKYSTQNIDVKYQKLNIDTTFTWIHNQHDTSFVDTINLLDISQLPDTVYITKLINRDSVILDSVKNYKYDSAYNNNIFVHCNRYYYFELPLIFGYSFSYKKLLFTVQAGGVFSWLTKSYVYSISENDGIKYFETKDFNRIAIDAYLGFRIKYEFSNLNGILLSPYIRYPIVEEFSNDSYIGSKNLRVGIRIGYLFSLF